MTNTTAILAEVTRNADEVFTALSAAAAHLDAAYTSQARMVGNMAALARQTGTKKDWQNYIDAIHNLERLEYLYEQVSGDSGPASEAANYWSQRFIEARLASL